MLWGVDASLQRGIEIFYNGTTVVARSMENAIQIVGLGASHSIAANYYLDVDDYVELRVRQNKGSDVSTVYGNEYSPTLAATRIG
jgi:hypothetical protein